MDGLWVAAAIAFFLLPIALLVLQIIAMDRQKQRDETLSKTLQSLEQTLARHTRLLADITQSLTESASKTEVAVSVTELNFSQQEPPSAAVAETVTERALAESVSVAETEPSPTPIEQVETLPPPDPWFQDARSASEPGRLELAAREILRNIWNWIIVGEGHRAEGMTIEYAVASNWLLRIGIVILVTGVGFFLKYSIDNGLLGEQARVALSVMTGVGMIVGGVRLLGGQYQLFSQGLLGGGIAVLYFSVFAAYSFYHLLPVYPTFALMIFVTACAATLAIRLDAMLVAIFAIIGGYCTPVMLSTGEVNFIGLFSYMLLLGIGILGINWYKHWHLLNFLGFFCHYLLFFAAMQNYQPEYFWQALPFLAGFFMLYSTMVFLFCLVNRSPASLLDLIALMINAGLFFATAYELIDTRYGQIFTALLTVALAAFYVAHVYFCLARNIVDKTLLLSFIGLAVFFITLTLPLLLSDAWITASWSIQAVIMLWLAGKLRSAFLQQLAYLVYAIMLLRFCFFDLPNQYGSSMDNGQTLFSFLLGLLARCIRFGIPIASLALGYRLIEKPAAVSTMPCDSANDVPLWLKDNWLLQTGFIAIAGLLFIVLQLELHLSLGYLYPPLQMPVLTLVWLALGWLLLMRFLAGSGPWLLKALQYVLLGLAIKLLIFDLPSWQLTLGQISTGDNLWSLRYGQTYSFQMALMRLLDFAAMIAFLVFAWQRLAGFEQSARLRQWLGGSALVLLFTFLSLEINSLLYQYVPGLRSGGVSILWSLFALSLVFNGIKRRIPLFRLVGLGLFALVAWKVFFIDLARLEQLYRILAFIVLGLLALGGAFFYIRYQQTFSGQAANEISS